MNAPESFNAKVRGIAVITGAYQDDKTAEWGMSDRTFMTIAARIRDELAKQDNTISGFYEEEMPTFVQGAPTHELQSIVTAEEVTNYVLEIKRLRDALTKQQGKPDTNIADYESLAMELAAEENDDIHHLIYEGYPPEPWGEVWQRYEGQAKAMIAQVKKHIHPAPVCSYCGSTTFWAADKYSSQIYCEDCMGRHPAPDAHTDDPEMNLTPERMEQLGDLAQQLKDVIDTDASGEERYDCPIHGLQDGPDCARC